MMLKDGKEVKAITVVYDTEDSQAKITDLGFDFGPLKIERVRGNNQEGFEIWIETPAGRVEVSATPKGQRVYVALRTAEQDKDGARLDTEIITLEKKKIRINHRRWTRT